MRLTQFKEGDIIHRTAPISHARLTGDRSFIEGKHRFLGIKSGLFFHQYVDEPIFGDDIRHSEVAFWDDDNWDYYPSTFLEFLKQKWSPRQLPPST